MARKHFDTEPEGWRVFPKKACGKTRISYNDAVEEALCFGWIDSKERILMKKAGFNVFRQETQKASSLKLTRRG